MTQYEIYELDDRSYYDFWELVNSGELKTLRLLTIVELDDDDYKAVKFATKKYPYRKLAIKSQKDGYVASCMSMIFHRH